MKISVVCPFFNEAAIIEKAVAHLETALGTLTEDWELILVNDGSRDDSAAVARAAACDARVHVVGYEINRGRGFALRFGAEHATGDIVVTTEIDLSWGEDIVHRLAEAFRVHPDADMIVASPHLPCGGYRNVPWSRVWLSSIGNRLLQAGQGGEMTMYTGMTRAYRREMLLALPLDEDEKEFHLEAAQKAQALGYRIYEIPCVLEWRTEKLLKPGSKTRTSSSRTRKLVLTHLTFALAAAPFRYVIPISIGLSVLALGFLIWAFVNLSTGTPSVYVFLVSLLLFLFAVVIFANGILSYQMRQLQHDLWRLRYDGDNMAVRVRANAPHIAEDFESSPRRSD